MSQFAFGATARFKIVEIAMSGWERTKAPIVKEAIQANTPVDSGELRNSITYRSIGTGGERTIRFRASSDHAVVNHDGHGVLTPKQAIAMVFSRGGEKVFTTRVRAVEGSRFFTKTLHELGFSQVTERSGR